MGGLLKLGSTFDAERARSNALCLCTLCDAAVVNFNNDLSLSNMRQAGGFDGQAFKRLPGAGDCRSNTLSDAPTTTFGAQSGKRMRAAKQMHAEIIYITAQLPLLLCSLTSAAVNCDASCESGSVHADMRECFHPLQCNAYLGIPKNPSS